MTKKDIVEEARAKRIRKEKELAEIMGAKYGTDPRDFN